MQKLLFFLFLVVIGIGSFFWFTRPSSRPLSFVVRHTPTATPAPAVDTQKSLFVPYWTIGNAPLPASYKELIYFGVSVNEEGIDHTDQGYKDLEKFVQSVSADQKTLLTVRMLDRDTNEKILQNKDMQHAVIQEAVTVAKQHKFDGIVLDLEHNAIAFDSVVNSITAFSQTFAQQAQEQNLSFYQAIYGDAFYRLRPYDVAAIGKASDGIFIMAYDLHKAGADPGPNYPLASRDEYTFENMVSDFLKKVPAEKLFVVLGMYGYSWPVDGKGQTIGQADAKSLVEIQQHTGPTCTYMQCTVSQENANSATKVTYTQNGKSYVLFFDNQQVVHKKEALVKEKGIGNISYWAYSYF